MDQEKEPLVLVAHAIIEYSSGRLPVALSCLKRVVELNPGCPVDIWLAIGVLSFKLNNLPKAKFAFEHVVACDPSNAMALTCLGITEL